MKKTIKTSYEYLLGFITLVVLILNTIIIFIPVFIFGLIKIIPNKTVKRWCSKALDATCKTWIAFNGLFIDMTRRIEWEVLGDNELNKKQWYLVISNHQSWVDIVVLQKILNHRIPMLKFFVKSQLKWVPLLGFAWWAIDCPFMKRYSKSYLEKHPEKKGLDLQATKKACEKFKNIPVSIMNFIEGTRFTLEKQAKQLSPYRHLLKPKAGGIAYVLNSMNEQIHTIIDVTIMYPNKRKSLMDYMCGRMNKIKVFVKQIPIPEQFINMNYFNDPKVRSAFHQWLNKMWQEKDSLIQDEAAWNSP